MENIHVKLFEIWTSGSEVILFKEKVYAPLMHDRWMQDGRWTKTDHNSSPELKTGAHKGIDPFSLGPKTDVFPTRPEGQVFPG